MKETAQDKAYSILKERILSLSLAPGTVISTRETALSLALGITPTREALIRLEREGLIEIKPQKEIQVTRIKKDRVATERFLRETLESGVFDIFLDRKSTADLIELDSLIARQAEAMAEGDNQRLFDLDNLFHSIFFSSASMLSLFKVVEENSPNYSRLRLLSLNAEGIAEGVITDHINILRALETDDVSAARSLLKNHLVKCDSTYGIITELFPAFLE